MSYAEVAGSSRSNGNSSTGNDFRNNQQERYFNEKMLVCMANGFTCEDLADALYANGLTHTISGLQSVDFNRRIAIVIEDSEVRDTLAINGSSLFIPGFFGWCRTEGRGCFPPPPCNSFVFQVRRLKFCTELLWERINILG